MVAPGNEESKMLEVNEYFEGRVKSIALQTATLPATVGVMATGEYTFGTSQKETMSVVSGELTVRLLGQDNWQSFGAGASFVVEADQSFDVKVTTETAYFCTYG